MEELIKYLSELLLIRGHFNIDDELALSNVDKYQKSILKLMINNPLRNLHKNNIKFNETGKEAIEQVANIIPVFMEFDANLGKKLEREYELFKVYKNIWTKSFIEEAKGRRGKKRQAFHRSFFQNNIFYHLKENNNFIKINEELNICYIDKNTVFFPNNFLDIIKIIENLKNNDKTLFFRGHDNSSYRLIPSIYRGNSSFFERELLYDAINLLPDEVKDATSNFEILTKLQHFGTPTRLLDITTNPLVALYFSCTKQRFNGEVLCFGVEKDRIKFFDSDTVSILSNLSKMPYNFNIKGSSGIELKDFNAKPEIRELVHKIRNEKSYFENVVVREDLMKSFFVVSKLNNPRIIRQSGAFIICGMDEVKTSPSHEIFDIEQNVLRRIIISKSLKNDIIKSLDIFNISSGSLFPDLSEVSRYIKSRYGL